MLLVLTQGSFLRGLKSNVYNGERHRSNMKTLQVTNGDLALDSGGRLQFLQGTNKLVQDLALWLQEPYGIGFTTPSFGSTLPGLIGGESTASTIALVQSEVQRIISLYQSQQIISLQNAQNLSQLGNWNKSEIINSINNIDVQQNYTSILVNVSITTLSNTNVSFSLFISSDGVQVNSG